MADWLAGNKLLLDGIVSRLAALYLELKSLLNLAWVGQIQLARQPAS